jgi:uncharacterized membrane protein YeaQ/YmgE (transglycosylase-associated protein family)
MRVNDVLSAILVGLVVGVLGRLILPGRQRIGAFVTLVIGILSALVGGWIAVVLKVNNRAPVHYIGLHWDWIVLAIQVGFAVLGTALAAAISHTRVATDGAPRRRTRTRRRA